MLSNDNFPHTPIPVQIRRFYAKRAHRRLGKRLIEFLKSL